MHKIKLYYGLPIPLMTSPLIRFDEALSMTSAVWTEENLKFDARVV